MHVETPHLSFPFRRYAAGVGGQVQIVEQDTPDDVMSCENVILRCPVGFRWDRPEFGVPLAEYATEIDDESLASALESWEPRSQVTASHVRNRLDAAQAIITVEVEV